MLMQYRDSLGDHFAGLNDLDTPANRAAAKPDRTAVRHRSKPPSPPGNSYTLAFSKHRHKFLVCQIIPARSNFESCATRIPARFRLACISRARAGGAA